jgi:RimJ/RimL family protein N-acetyltransferase
MFARTERLLLRPGFIEDAPALLAAIADEAVARNTSQPWPYALADAEAFLTQPTEPLLPRMLMVRRTGGKPCIVGGIGVRREPDPLGGERLLLGYWVAQPFWGLGYASEAGRAVMANVRAAGLPPLQARHFLDNPASGAVLRKIGFRSTGRVERVLSAARGVPADCAVLAEDRDADIDVPRMCADDHLMESLRLIAA